MTRSMLVVSLASVLALGCGKSNVMQPRVSPSEVKAADVREDDAEESKLKDGLLKVSLSDEGLALTPSGTFAMRSLGDYVVYRFSGSYRDTPVTVSQRVVERGVDDIAVEMLVDDGGEQLRLRLRLDDRAATRGEVLTVSRLQGDALRPFGVAAYEQLMSEIMLSADDNEAQLSVADTTVELGKRAFAARRYRYRVRVGAHSAIMETVSSPDYTWGDLGGRIETTDGKLLYKTEIIDAGGHGFGAPQIAVQAPEEDEPDYEDFE